MLCFFRLGNVSNMLRCDLICKLFHQTLCNSVAATCSQRNAGTFARLTGKQLWNSTSPEARRTGRGKRAHSRRKVDFSKFKVIGEGDAGIVWPGLNEHVTAKQRQRTEEEQAAYLAEREEKTKRQPFARETTRGWTGAHWGGVKLGPPLQPIHGQDFGDFEGVIMDVARVSHMNMKMGRVYSTRATVAVGNGKGLVGVSSSVAMEAAGAFRKARNKALNRLNYVERWENRTVYEDIYVNHHKTWLSIRQQPEGYGLRCHRALREMCKLIGFKDMYIKVDGSTTMLNLLKCFMKGVLSQETHQQKADRLGYHVVQFDELHHNYPVVLASPSGEVNTEPHDDYEEYLNQELIIRDVRRAEEGCLTSFSKAIATDNRGIPVPSSRSVPDVLRNLKNIKLD